MAMNSKDSLASGLTVLQCRGKLGRLAERAGVRSKAGNVDSFGQRIMFVTVDSFSLEKSSELEGLAAVGKPGDRTARVG